MCFLANLLQNPLRHFIYMYKYVEVLLWQYFGVFGYSGADFRIFFLDFKSILIRLYGKKQYKFLALGKNIFKNLIANSNTEVIQLELFESESES